MIRFFFNFCQLAYIQCAHKSLYLKMEKTQSGQRRRNRLLRLINICSVSLKSKYLFIGTRQTKNYLCAYFYV